MSQRTLYLSAAFAVIVLTISGALAYQYFTSADYFLAKHWQHPLAPQGNPPAHFSELEASLSPQACGQCHEQQYQDWQYSLHSKTMQAGIQWQLLLMDANAANKCLNCHAPLAEQKALVAIEQGWPNAPKGNLPSYVSEDLAQQGLVCAACHVRQHQRFGPEPLLPLAGRAHDGFVVNNAFSQSEFCAGCHQFPEDGARTAGKLRENTYQEWLASPYAEQGVQCQSCHMPERKHQWQGIHTPSMLEQAVSSTLIVEGEVVVATLTNSGAGHLLPTYMVPKIHVQIWYDDGQTARLLNQKTIGWQVSDDLLTEQFDTRLAPNQSLVVQAKLPNNSHAGRVFLQLEVHPDEHYNRAFNKSLDYAEQLSAPTLSLLKQAERNTASSVYYLVLAEQLLKTL